MQQSNGSLSLFKLTPELRSATSGPPFYISRDIFIYLESACHDDQNGGQSFVLRPRIAKLWRFKGCKVENNGEENHIAFFKVDLWLLGFFGYGKEWYLFQQELMVSKLLV